MGSKIDSSGAWSDNPSLRPQIASNPATPADILVHLSQDQDAAVRESVAGNPNTLWPTLEQLAWSFPHAFLHNPVGLLLMVVHPEQISTDSMFWTALLREASIPTLWWNWLESHPELDVSQTMRLHVRKAGETMYPYGAPQEADEHMLLTLLGLLTAAIAQGVFLPPIIDKTLVGQLVVTGEQSVRNNLQWLACSLDEKVRKAVAESLQTPIEILRTLALDQDPDVRRAVFGNPRTPMELLRTLALDDEYQYVRRAVATNEQMPEEVLRSLAQDADEEVRRLIAQNKQTPVEALQMLARDQSASVRYWVAVHPQMPMEDLRTLAKDRVWHVRRAVAENQQTSMEDLQKLAQDEVWDVREAVAGNSQTPGDVLCTLVCEEEWEGARREAAKNPQMPVEMLRILAHDQDALVREAVAAHQQTPTEVILTLAQDQDWRVREAVAMNVQTPKEVLRALAKDLDTDTRRLVASHPQTPKDVVRALTQDDNESVQWTAKLAESLLRNGNQRLSAKVRGALSFWDPGDYVNKTIGTLPIGEQLDRAAELDAPADTRQTIIAALAVDWTVTAIQGAYFRNDKRESMMLPFMPPIALQKLATSPQWDVRYLVALHTQTPWETRQRLSQDGNRYVRAMARATIESMQSHR